MNIDWLLAIALMIPAIMAALGHNFSVDHFETGDKE